MGEGRGGGGGGEGRYCGFVCGVDHGRPLWESQRVLPPPSLLPPPSSLLPRRPSSAFQSVGVGGSSVEMFTCESAGGMWKDAGKG